MRTARIHKQIASETITGTKDFPFKWGHNERGTFQVRAITGGGMLSAKTKPHGKVGVFPTAVTFWATLDEYPQEPNAVWSQLSVKDLATGLYVSSIITPVDSIVQVESLCAAWVKVRVVATIPANLRITAELDAL